MRTEPLEGYETVQERIRRFKTDHPEGSLQPLFTDPPHFMLEALGERTFLVYGAKAYRSSRDSTPGIGLAWELYPGQDEYTRGAELMNAETSAWGRALAALGYPGSTGVASADEVLAARGRREPSRNVVASDEQLDEWAKAHTLDELIEGLAAIGVAVPDDQDPSPIFRGLSEFQFAQLRQTAKAAAAANGGDAA